MNSLVQEEISVAPFELPSGCKSNTRLAQVSDGGLTKAMAQEHVEALKQLRIRMVEQRRALAGRDADLGYSDTRTQSLVALQAAIEAVDRAIADELGLVRDQHESIPEKP